MQTRNKSIAAFSGGGLRVAPGWCATARVAALVCCVVAQTVQAQAGAPAPVTGPPVGFTVQSFEVTGNTLLPADSLQARLVEFKGASTLQGLRAAAAAVQDLYRRAGYGGVVAFLPEQALSDGVVHIRVVEGKLARVDVSGNRQFSSANVLASLPALAPGRTPDVRRIDAQIQLANENPAKNVQVLLQPGADVGAIDAKVSVAEEPVQHWTARVDNTGSERTGRWRAALGWQDANVLDRDHVFAAEVQTAPENPSAVAVVSGSYRMPLYAPSMAVDVYGAWSDVDAGKVGSSAGDLQFAGRGSVVGARGSAYLPRLGNTDQRLILGLEWREYLNNCAIDGLPDGACGAAGASVGVLPLSLTYSVQTAGDVRLNLSVGLLHNLALGVPHGSAADFDAVRKGSPRSYSALRASAGAATPVLDGGVLSARLSAQGTTQALVPGEQFGLGGAQSVRGFEEREITGDSGAQLTVEFLGPNVAQSWFGLAQGEQHGLAFADAGWVGNHHDDPCLGTASQCHMGSLGVGWRATYAQLQLRLDLACAMTDANTTRKGDAFLHVSLGYSF